MTLLGVLFVVCAMPVQSAQPGEGSIGGIVRNGSEGELPVAGAEVVLRVAVDGQLMIAAEATADGEGRFLFAPLPLRSDLHYLPGASRDGVHYPGERIRLTPESPRAHVTLVVYDAVAEPCPLVARRHEIIVRPQPGALEVTETIVVDNPTSTCYVGRPASDGAEPVTLQLAVPSDFERTTFHAEFFGRRFSLARGKLVTAVPWPPGQRELKFTYLLRNAQEHRVWNRPIDLPCSELRLCVYTDRPEEVTSNLGPGATPREGQKVFESRGQTLPAGYKVRLEMGRLPISWLVYGRWVAMALLLGLIGGTTVVMLGRRGHKSRRAQTLERESGSRQRRQSTSRQSARTGRRRRRRRTSAHRLP